MVLPSCQCLRNAILVFAGPRALYGGNVMKTECSACGKAFSGTRTFDEHRVGKYIDIHPHYGRRCLTAEELLAKGLSYNNNVWSRPRV